MIYIDIINGTYTLFFLRYIFDYNLHFALYIDKLITCFAIIYIYILKLQYLFKYKGFNSAIFKLNINYLI